MANTYAFKSVITEDVSTGGSTVLSMSSSPDVLNAIVIGFEISNLVGSAINVDVVLNKAGGSSGNLLKTVEIPVGSTLNVVKGNKLIVESGDSITVTSDTATSADVVISYLEETVVA